MFRVVIEFDGRHDVIGPPYPTRNEAEWALAHWFQTARPLGRLFKVEEEFGPYPAASQHLFPEPQEWAVYRHGSNTANQPGDNEPVHVATVTAADGDAACSLAAKRVTVYHNQHLSARLASEVETEEADLDVKVRIAD